MFGLARSSQPSSHRPPVHSPYPEPCTHCTYLTLRKPRSIQSPPSVQSCIQCLQFHFLNSRFQIRSLRSSSPRSNCFTPTSPPTTCWLGYEFVPDIDCGCPSRPSRPSVKQKKNPSRLLLFYFSPNARISPRLSAPRHDTTQHNTTLWPYNAINLGPQVAFSVLPTIRF